MNRTNIAQIEDFMNQVQKDVGSFYAGRLWSAVAYQAFASITWWESTIARNTSEGFDVQRAEEIIDEAMTRYAWANWWYDEVKGYHVRPELREKDSYAPNPESSMEFYLGQNDNDRPVDAALEARKEERRRRRGHSPTASKALEKIRERRLQLQKEENQERRETVDGLSRRIVASLELAVEHYSEQEMEDFDFPNNVAEAVFDKLETKMRQIIAELDVKADLATRARDLDEFERMIFMLEPLADEAARNSTRLRHEREQAGYDVVQHHDRDNELADNEHGEQDGFH